MRLSEPQQDSYETVLDPAVRECVLVGPYGSGKSAVGLYATMTFLALHHSGAQAALITAGRDAMTALVDEQLLSWAEGMQVRVAQKAHGYQVGENFVWRVVGVDKRSVSRLKGRNLAAVFCDEATEVPEALYDQAHDRLRVAPSVFCAATNPDLPGHWLKRHIDTSDAVEVLLPLHANPTLPVEYVAAQCQRHKGAEYERYVLGKWAMGPLAAFPWLEDALTDEEPPDIVQCGIAVDVGQAVPTHALLFGHDRLMRVWVLGEWQHDPRLSGAMRPSDQVSAIADWCKQAAPVPVSQGIVDQADRPFEDLLDAAMKRVGVKVGWVNKPKQAVKQGIKAVSRRMYTKTLKIRRAQCPMLVAECSSRMIDAGRAMRGVEETDSEQDDHGPDALRYYVVHVVEGW